MNVKKIISLVLSVLMLTAGMTTMVSCGFLRITDADIESESQATGSETHITDSSQSIESEKNKENESSQAPADEDREYHVLITSDMHYTTLSSYYGIDRDVRLQYWVNGILEEHKRNPFDLIIILGDMSLDYWGWNGGGSYQRNPSVSDTKIFMEKFVSQLPADVPTLVLPGNHELYTNDKWKEITGNNRNESFILGDNLFIIPDSFSGAVDPKYEGKGKNDSPYAPLDMEFIQSEIDKHPECKNIFLVSHSIDLSNESEKFKTLLQTEERIVALFSGHTHSYSVESLGGEYNNLKKLQTGNFAENGSQTVEAFSWGYRDIIISDENIMSSYITPDSEYYVDGVKYTETRKYVFITKIK